METNIENITRRIFKHIYRQPYRCSSGDKCLYRMFYRRSNAVDKCFVGALIPDEQYEPRFEIIGGINEIARNDGLHEMQKLLDLPNPVTANDIDFLWAVQRIHDTSDKSCWVNDILREKEYFTEREA